MSNLIVEEISSHVTVRRYDRGSEGHRIDRALKAEHV